MPQPFGWAWAAEQLCCQPLLCQPQPALFSASEQAVEHCAATEICPPVQVYFKKLNCKKSGGFVKLIDCEGYLVNLASTEYRSITEKFKGFFIKLMDIIIILTKFRVFYKIHGVRHDY